MNTKLLRILIQGAVMVGNVEVDFVGQSEDLARCKGLAGVNKDEINVGRASQQRFTACHRSNNIA